MCHVVRASRQAMTASVRGAVDIEGATVPDPSLRCVAHRLEAGTSTKFRVETFGTSITAGGYKKEVRFQPYLRRLLIAAFPRSPNIVVDTHGYSGASAEYLHACVDRLLPSRAHLYVVELCDNFLSGPKAAIPAGKTVGDLVNTLRARPGPASGPTSVLLLAPFAQSCAKKLARRYPYAHLPRDPQTTNALIDGCLRSFHPGDAHNSTTTLPAVLEAVADDMHLGIVSVRRAFARTIRAFGQSAGGGAQGAAEASIDGLSKLLRTYIQQDMVHPNAEGYQLMAELVVQLLKRAAREATPSECARARDVPLPSQLPQHRSWAHQPIALASAPPRVCAFGEEMHAHIRSALGWTYQVELSPSGRQKPGFIATRPGARLETCFRPGRISATASKRQVRGPQAGWAVSCGSRSFSY